MTKAQDDAAIAVADLLLEEKFENGRLLVHATNQEFYRFEETHWCQFLPNLVKQHILDTAQDFRDDDKNDLQFRPSTIFAAAKDVLIARTAKATDVFNFQGSPPAVVNTRNAEVWIGKEGEVDVREHSPESYLLTCLDTEYDPDAECPMMDTALEQILRENKEPAEMIRHIWEFAGYAIQPVKNIPAWWLWWGDGSNGKSMVAKVIMGLLGEGAVLPRPIEAFSDKGRNAHATASLVGKLLVVDDDAETTTNLPESALKKLAQSNPMEANPKNQHAFTFRCCATPLILVNGWPRTKDLSHGMRRKAYILPWRRRFTEDEMDFDLEDKILKTELPGVLNRALAGYQRLRRRGRFAEPIECVEAKGDWLRSANPLIEFVSSHLRKTGNGTFVPLSELYSDYQAWCHIVGGVSRPLTQNRFSVAIQQLDYTVDETNTIRGVERLEN
jgi:P4 family phage/plasmid primase-like protien